MKNEGFHPLSEIFPPMTGVQFAELVEDIRANGLREPIWLYQNKVIDGRNRFNACVAACVQPQYREWDGNGDLTKFVISMNLHRRHLSESQRAMVAARLANRPIGRTTLADKRDAEADVEIYTSDPTAAEAAGMLNVSTSSVMHAKKVRRDAVPEVVQAVESGEISLHAAEKIIAEPREQQVEALTAKREGMRREPTNGNPMNGIVPHTRRNHSGRKAPEAVRGAIGTLVGLATGLDSFTVIDAAPTPEEIVQWDKDLKTVLGSIRRFRSQLKEIAHV